MARLTCGACDRFVAEVTDDGWRITHKAEGVEVVDVSETTAEADSASIWSDFDVVEARAEEWRDKGVYDPLPPPPDPPNSALALTCPCGRTTRHIRPGTV